MKETVLVIGGTGTLGQPISHALQDAGLQVRIMTRDLSKAKKFYHHSFQFFEGDPMYLSCLEEAMHGCYGVHIGLPSEVEEHVAENVAKVADKHGVERITYLSGATVAEETRWFPMVNRKFMAEMAIAKSGIPYTIFCPTWLMEALPLFVRGGRASVLGEQACAYHWVAAEDCARMIATAYALGQAAFKRIIVLGPEAIRMDEALRRYCEALEPDIKEVSRMPLRMVTLLAAITRDHELKGAGELMSYFDKVGEGSATAQGDGVLGAPTITLDRWLEARKVGEPVRGELVYA